MLTILVGEACRANTLRKRANYLSLVGAGHNISFSKKLYPEKLTATLPIGTLLPAIQQTTLPKNKGQQLHTLLQTITALGNFLSQMKQ